VYISVMYGMGHHADCNSFQILLPDDLIFNKTFASNHWIRKISSTTVLIRWMDIIL